MGRSCLPLVDLQFHKPMSTDVPNTSKYEPAQFNVLYRETQRTALIYRLLHGPLERSLDVDR